MTPDIKNFDPFMKFEFSILCTLAVSYSVNNACTLIQSSLIIQHIEGCGLNSQSWFEEDDKFQCKGHSGTCTNNE